MSESLVIIGVGPNLGLSIGRAFGSRGSKVALIARRDEALQRYAATLREEGITAVGIAADAGDPPSLRAALDRAELEHGSTTVLVYNAVAHPAGNPLDLPVDDLVSTFEVNVGGALVAAQHVAGGMRRGSKGTILFTGGGNTFDGIRCPIASSLTITKTSLRALAFALADQLGPAGVHVATINILGSIEPGSRFDPDLVAESYWALHDSPPTSWLRELVFWEHSGTSQDEMLAMINSAHS